jgi:hypothetical protein
LDQTHSTLMATEMARKSRNRSICYVTGEFKKCSKICGKVTDKICPQQEFMTYKMKDDFSWLYGKKLVVSTYMKTGITYPHEDGDGEFYYVISLETLAKYNKWLDSMPLLRALE